MSNFSDRIKNLEKIISEFQKEDNINNLTRVNAVCNTIENQLGKQHTTKLFKNLQEAEAEAEELDIDSVAKELAEILKSIRSTKFPAPLHTSGNGDRIENFDGNGDNSEENDIRQRLII